MNNMNNRINKNINKQFNIKKTFNKSLIELYLKNGYVPHGHHKLNSIRKDNHVNKAYENNEDDYMQIKIKIPETDMEFKTKIRIIKSIEDWDIISWFKEFESISVQNA